MQYINLEAYQDRFVELIKIYLKKHGMEQQELAKRVGIDASLMSSLLSSNAKRRKLSANTILPFLIGGIIKVEQIHEGALDVADEKERRFWTVAKVLERWSLMSSIAKYDMVGGNLDMLERDIKMKILDKEMEGGDHKRFNL